MMVLLFIFAVCCAAQDSGMGMQGPQMMQQGMNNGMGNNMGDGMNQNNQGNQQEGNQSINQPTTEGEMVPQQQGSNQQTDYSTLNFAKNQLSPSDFAVAQGQPNPGGSNLANGVSFLRHQWNERSDHIARAKRGEFRPLVGPEGRLSPMLQSALEPIQNMPLPRAIQEAMRRSNMGGSGGYNSMTSRRGRGGGEMPLTSSQMRNEMQSNMMRLRQMSSNLRPTMLGNRMVSPMLGMGNMMNNNAMNPMMNSNGMNPMMMGMGMRRNNDMMMGGGRRIPHAF